MKIVLTGGGTAGHVIPNLALIDDLRRHFDQIIYIGSGKQLEKRLVVPYGIEYFGVETPKLQRKLTLKNLEIPFKLHKSIAHCKQLLREINPNVVFSKGGYASLPTVIAAHKLNIKIVAHESDLSIGLANKISKHYCNKICTTFEINKNDKFVYTGAPVRKDFRPAKVNSPFKNDKPTVLFIGGSQGAKELNDFVLCNLDNLTEKYNIIHLCGNGKTTGITNSSYKEIEFSNEMPTLLNQSDIVVTRGGSNALFEILAVNKPMIICPLSKKVSRGDQVENANYFHKNRLGYHLKQLDVENLMLALESQLKKANSIKETQKRFFSRGNEKIVQTILQVVNSAT